MSETLSVGVVGPSYWSYTALSMARVLESIIEGREIIPAKIPRGVYSDARRFFSLALSAVNGGVPSNLAASNNAYLLASDLVVGLVSQEQESAADSVDELLTKYSEFLSSLSEPRQTSDEDLKIATSLKEFFQTLHDSGTQERYEERIHGEDLPVIPSSC